jgi:TatD DNase family protein
LCPSEYGEKAFAAVCEFLKDAPKYIPSVSATAVSCPDVDPKAVKKFVEGELKVHFREREYQDVG